MQVQKTGNLIKCQPVHKPTKSKAYPDTAFKELLLQKAKQKGFDKRS